GAEQCRSKSRIDEACVTALRNLRRSITCERVRERDRCHGDLVELIGRQRTQLLVEGAAAEEEARVYEYVAPRIRYAPFENAGAPQRQEAVDQHLAASVETLLEGSIRGAGSGWLAQPRHEIAKTRTLRVAQDERVRQGVGEGANADLQR